MIRHRRFPWGTILVLGLLTPSLVFASNISSLPLEVPAKNEYYGIQKVEASKEPGILKFEVLSAHAVYEVEGFRPLLKLLHEIQVIERIRRNKEGSGFFDGAAASVEATMDGFENLVTHPIDSAKGLGKAAGKVGRGIGGMFRKKDEGEKSSFGEKVLGTQERELAKEFGVDVYTTNPYLKALLTKMARSRLGGKSAVMVIKFLVPVAFVASVAMAAGGINGAADQLINDTDRKELYRLNKEAFLKMAIDPDTTIQLLNLPYFSPREQTYLRFYLERLHKAENFIALVKNTAKEEKEWPGRRQLYELEMAAALAEKTPAKKLWDFPEGLALLNEKGVLQYAAAYDDLSGGLEKKILEQLEDLKKETGAAQVEIYNTGGISSSFTKEARQKGFREHSWACLESEANKTDV